jgi:hypothetical protein
MLEGYYMSKWIDVTDTYLGQKPIEHDDTMCDWGPGCNNKIQFRVTLQDGYKRHLCKEHFEERIKNDSPYKVAELKIEELMEV